MVYNMHVDRSKNASRNIIFGVLLKVYQIVCPFIIRTAMIYILGMEYVGLNSLFTAILQVLNMTELGVGTAMVFSMYKPIAEDESDKICALMQLYKQYYRIIGGIIAVVGLAITPVVPMLISQGTQIPLNIYYLYWLNLGYTVLSYWLFAYKNSILQAHQRNDVISKVTLATNTCMYVLQFGLLVISKNYYLYLIGMLFGLAMSNVVTAVVADKMYPEYKAHGKLSHEEKKEINKRIKDLFTAKVGGVIQNSTDSIVISVFLGLTILGQYNNYYYILNSVFGFIVIVLNACLAGIGNSLVLETKEKNYNDLLKIALLIEWISCFASCSLLCLYQPFVTLWVGHDNVLPFGINIGLAIYLYIIATNQMLCLYKDASGIWHSDRFRPLITAAANLIMNLVSVRFLGLYGIVLSTVISLLCIGIPWLIHNLFRTVFDRSSKEFSLMLIKYATSAILVSCATYFVANLISYDGILQIIIRLLLCILIPNLSYFMLYRNTPEFSGVITLVGKLLPKKISNSKFFIKYTNK